MTIECIHCHARYSIADSLVPPQGARVKCKKCGQVFPIKPPAAEPAPTEMALVPPTPEPVAPPRVPEPVAPPPVPASVTPPPVPASVTPSAPAPAAPPPVPEPSHASVAYEQFVAPAHGGPSPAALAATHAPSATQAEAGHPPAPAAPPPTPAAPPPAPATPPPAPAAPEAEAPPSAPPAAAPTPPPSAAPSPATAAPAASTGVPLPAGTPIPEGLSPEERQRHERARRLARVLASDIAIYNREKRDRGIQDGNLVAVLGYEIKKSWDIYKERVGAEFANATPYFRDALNEIVAEGKKVF